MKTTIISGSLAYDRIMNFHDLFSNHILADKIHDLNVCFQVDGVTENFGGTAGNIAYALKMLGGEPYISATIGRDSYAYLIWLQKNGIDTSGIVEVKEELTAGAYITTDRNNNQITGFNPGAMKYSSNLLLEEHQASSTILLVSPGNLLDMIDHPRQAKKLDIPYIFDPGQALPVLHGDDLREVISGAMLLIVNDYEFNLIMDKCRLSKEELLALPMATIITLGENGSELYQNGAMQKIAACQAEKVVDPTGAGDAYRGGLLAGLRQGLDLYQSGQLGSACASFAVQENGTQVYRFTPQQFEERRAQLDD